MTDRFNVRVVVVALAVCVTTGLAIMGLLSFVEKPIPDQFDRLVTFLAGGLTAVLVSTKGGSEDEATEVVIKQPANEPVPVKEKKP